MSGKNYLKNTKMNEKDEKEALKNERDELTDRYYAILEEMLKETINC